MTHFFHGFQAALQHRNFMHKIFDIRIAELWIINFTFIGSVQIKINYRISEMVKWTFEYWKPFALLNHHISMISWNLWIKFKWHWEKNLSLSQSLFLWEKFFCQWILWCSTKKQKKNRLVPKICVKLLKSNPQNDKTNR